MTGVREVLDDELRAGGAGGAVRDCMPYSDELLVDMVRARSNLFDKGRVDYKDEQTKAQSWESIATALGMRGECVCVGARCRQLGAWSINLCKQTVPGDTCSCVT